MLDHFPTEGRKKRKQTVLGELREKTGTLPQAATARSSRRHLLGFISRYVMFSPLLHLFIPSLFNLSLSSSLHLLISPSLPNPCSSSLLFKFFSLHLSAESNPCFFSSQPKATRAPPLLSRKKPLLLLFAV